VPPSAPAPHVKTAIPVPPPMTMRHCKRPGAQVLSEGVTKPISFQEERDGEWFDVLPILSQFPAELEQDG
jgi:hypothetical protein